MNKPNTQVHSDGDTQVRGGGERETGRIDSPTPRGNPETDHAAVTKGEEQLEKVSGN